MLQCKTHKEGIWDHKLAAAIARKVIDIEECDFYKNAETVVKIDLFSLAAEHESIAEVLPLKHRLGEVKVVLPEDSTGRIMLICRRKGNSGVWETIVGQYYLPSQRWSEVLG